MRPKIEGLPFEVAAPQIMAELKDQDGEYVTVYPDWRQAFYSSSPNILAMGGEGSGKSYMAALFATCHSVVDAAHGAKLYWVIGNAFEDARKEFDYILDFQEQMGNVHRKTVSDILHKQCTLRTKTGQLFVTISCDDPTRIAREEPDGIVGCEVAAWRQSAFTRALTRLVRRYGRSWGFFTGSFESSLGWLPDLFKVAQGPNDMAIRSYSIPTWANRKIYPLGREDPGIKRAEASMSPSAFQERFGGVPVPARAVILSEFRAHRHIDPELDYDFSQPVYLAVDPGSKVYAVLFCQFARNGEIWVVDEVYVERLSHEQVISICKDKPGWHLVRKDDAGTIDVAAKQPHMGMPMPIEEWARTTGCMLWAQRCEVDDSIGALRHALSDNPLSGRPRLRVHPRCLGLISEMGGGPSPIEGGGPWRRYETAQGLGPPIPQNDHACKALAYLLQAPRYSGAIRPETEALAPVSSVSYMGTKATPRLYSYFRKQGIAS